MYINLPVKWQIFHLYEALWWRNLLRS